MKNENEQVKRMVDERPDTAVPFRSEYGSEAYLHLLQYPRAMIQGLEIEMEGVPSQPRSTMTRFVMSSAVSMFICW